jgi:hypothetical protein
MPQNTQNPIYPAARRWATMILCATRSAEDLRTIRDWAKTANISQSTIRGYCHLAGISTRQSLLFARLCRAVLLAQAASCHPEDLLDVRDPRTLKKLMRMARLPQDVPTLQQFLRDQIVISDCGPLRAFEQLVTSTEMTHQHAQLGARESRNQRY